MKKNKLINFISKYHLNGIVNSVRWNICNNKLTTNFMLNSKILFGTIETQFEDYDINAEIGIYETNKLYKMLGILKDDINFKLLQTKDVYRMLELTDDVVNVRYMLSELDIIEKSAELVYIPDYEITINLTKEIIDVFLKSKKAIDISDNFYITGDILNETCYFKFGEGTNTIKISVKCNISNDLQQIAFSTENFSEILSVNKDFNEGICKISSEGLLYVYFKNNDFESKYYLIAKINNE